MKKAAYFIPLAALLAILYLNYLPFGYDRTFVIEAGKAGDRDGEFYLLSSEGLSERETAADGSNYRMLAGATYAIFKPDAILRNATATVSVSDEGVYLISPRLEIDPQSLDWSYDWNASAACEYFNGSTTRQYIPSSEGILDGGAFSVYAEWNPEDKNHAFQEIVGHYHWGLIQNKDDVEFTISTAEGEEGVRSIRYPIDDSKFFGRNHSALAIYAPADEERANGHIDLYVDGAFAGRTYFEKEKVLQEGLADRSITLGKSGHSDAAFFRGCIGDIRIMKEEIETTSKQVTFHVDRTKKEYAIPVINGRSLASVLRNLTLHVVQE